MTIRHTLLRRLLAPAIARGHTFARDEKAATTIEFAILALPFFTIIFAILETVSVMFASSVLDSAIEDASRLIRTGQAQAAGFTPADFRAKMCGYTFNLFGADCSAVRLRVTVLNNFASAITAPTIQTCDTATCTWTLAETYDPGVGRQIIQIQAYYRWPLIVTLPYFNLKNQPDNYRMISAVRVFRNEPF